MKLELNHWYIKQNEMSIMLLRFYVIIKILNNENTIYYQTIVGGEDSEEIFEYNMLEDAIYFTEKIVATSNSMKEILDRYRENEKRLVRK